MPSIRTQDKGEKKNQTRRNINNINRNNRGAVKTVAEWKRYWKLYKRQVRRKYNRIKNGENLKLNTYEARVLKILCDDEEELKNIDGLIDPNLECNPDIEDDHLQPEDDDSADSSYMEELQDVKTEEDVTRSVVMLEGGVDSENAWEENVYTEKIKEHIQVEILQFNLKRQREMHELETEQIKQRHKIEMEILLLKKQKAMLELDLIRNN